LKKKSPNNSWSEFDLSPVMTNPALGLTELIVDKSNNIWIGSRKNGTLVFNELCRQAMTSGKMIIKSSS
jgi:hypothetical protein